jgi:hypothetical protein
MIASGAISGRVFACQGKRQYSVENTLTRSRGVTILAADRAEKLLPFSTLWSVFLNLSPAPLFKFGRIKQG